MQYCLAESARDIDRENIQKSAAVGFHCDGANKRFSLRYNCVTKADHTLKQGQLGMLHDIGTGSDCISIATINAMERFCTRGLCPPEGVHAETEKDTALLQHLTESVQLLDADKASDEVRAAKNLQSVLPNCRWRVSDKTHASRRLISKPWGVDTVINDVLVFLMMGRDSFTKLIENSPDIKRIFSKYVKATEASPVDRSRVRNLQ